MLTEQLDWEKTDGMMPAIVQHAISGEVLMLGLHESGCAGEDRRER
ncbi:bifunctional phosphoribosyl-AMP cyclohydrolase /phosphoribosyl-ATP pyrophosphatase protein [Raoultella planticola]|uniref:Bifunctional phosphoribosyl-AMP cyclohydrolase /phosphoribosyl-ATP pyrophosphatase protein n=1 Tax=Raoultella planticola TaxID=575 RepID=A0A485D032_RAOPL|nr:bifunctional phosphoribosyl-AMP cyclohydrolase /phosphoribosyl-ATP pyrophosphatase protein [Raoultella planticola]